MKILVTGSSGYIGSHLLNLMPDVDTLDIEGFPTYLKDIRQPIDLNNEYDVVIHLAAKVQVGESVKDPYLYYDTNINGTKNVLGIKTKHFILASTGAAEHMHSPYAISKKAAEDVVVQYCKKNNINYSIFRFYNVIGSTNIAPTNPDGLFYSLLKAVNTGVFKIYGNDYPTPDGTCIRDYVHVEEICGAIIKAIDAPANQIECLGHGYGSSVLEIANMFQQINNVRFKIEYADRRDGDVALSVLKETSSYLPQLYNIQQMLKV